MNLLKSILIIFPLLFVSKNSSISQAPKEMNVIFENVENQKIRRCFLTALKGYEALQSYSITLLQKPIKSSTMQAQPVISFKSLISGVKSYRVKLAEYVRDSKQVKVADLPEDVLTGWFAHELGHIADYEPYSNLGMISYGLRYLISDRFKREVEHAADYMAIAHGFKDEILASKHWILDHEFSDNTYQDKIKKYYLSIKEVELCPEGEPLLEPVLAP
ncbi:hypothetical protein [Marinoscillum furvescens]|uniref:Uncharacterized protein n=1 Tax=Marinoscillum furvescens DSM 4134 TaxID=1122208 RepID=A0A3D9KZ00_MARFU|nr:hypothetical protein [Marinoscillum furvescens]RED94907.1 hypothetical protein C7460_11918 [Marinoscillum furvescens DSM 4134]